MIDESVAYSQIPRQKLTEKEKTKEWAEKTVKSFIDLSKFNKSYFSQTFTESLYKYYNGEIETSDYTHVTKPYDNKRRNFPAKLHNYNIIKPTVDRLLGEKSNRGLQFTVINSSPEAVTAKKIAKRDFLRRSAQQYFLSQLASNGFDVENEIDNIPEPEMLDKQFENDYVDQKAIQGQHALNFLSHNLELEDNFLDCLKDYLISGTTASYRGENDDEVFWDRINPLDIDGDKDPDIEFWEDGDWACIRKASYPSAVIDYYYDDLTSDQISRLENPRGQYNSDFILRTGTSSQLADHDSTYERRDRAIEVIRCYWKTRKRIGFVTYEDEFGFIQEKIVEEGYEPDFDESIEWKWVNEVWEGHRIDGDIYVRLQRYKNQRWNMDNPSKCKLPINGTRYSAENSGSISLVMLGIPYQISYNIYKYRLELAIAKSKDRVGQFDINMIPKKWTPEDFLYWVESTGIAWVDYNKEDIKISPQHQAVMDLTIQTVDKYIQLLQTVIQEWERISGVNAEMGGTINPYQGKGVTEQALFQGSLVTEEIFRKFRRFEKRELQALLDYSKPAWRNGKKAEYISTDGKSQSLDIDGDSHMESEYGVFVANNQKDLRNLRLLKENVQALIQNGAPLSTVADILRSDSFENIKQKIKEVEEIEAQQAQAIREAELAEKQEERQHEKELEDREDERQQREIESEMAIAEMNNQARKEIAALKQPQTSDSE